MEIPEINKRIKQVIDYKTNGVVKKFADRAKIQQQTLNRLFIIDKRTGKYPVVTTDVLQKISEMYDIDTRWLLTGRGEMLQGDSSPLGIIETSEVEDSIPLIPVEAMAGYAGGDTQVMHYDITSRYIVPDFEDKGVEYLIRASGSSMYPKYSNGDLLACRPIKDISFIQWGKVYVLDTDQGALVKRLFECNNDPECLECRSDNSENYPPFRIYKSSVRGIAIVVGVIRLE